MSFLYKKKVGIVCACFCVGIVSAVFLISCGTPPATVPVEKTETPSNTTDTTSPFDEEAFTTISFAQHLSDLLAANKIDEALSAFALLPAEYENDIDLRLLHASLLISSGDMNAAEVLATDLLARDSDNLDVLFLNMLIAKGKGEDARKSTLLKKIIAVDPHHADANAELGNEQMKRRNFPLAKTYYAKSLGADPAHYAALVGYGQVNYYLNNLSEAKKSFERVVEIDPTNSIAYSYLAKLEAEKDRFATAAAYMEKAIALEDGYYDYWIEYGEYMRRLARDEEALVAWSRAIEIDSEYFLAYVYRGGLRDNLNQYEGARADYEQVVRLNPSYYFAYESLGVLLWREGRWTDCRVAFEQAYARNKSNVSYILMISASYLKEGKNAANKTFLMQALKNLPSGSLEYAIARLYYDNTGENDVVLKLSKESNATMRGKVLYYFALYYQLNGKKTLAEKYFIEVKTIPSPQFFEYRLNDWALQDMGLAF